METTMEPVAGTLAAARQSVLQLSQARDEANTQLQSAIACSDGHSDLNALQRRVRRLGQEVEKAQAALAQAEEEETSHRLVEKLERFDLALAEAREARAKFQSLYRDAALALGSWYQLGLEVRELTTALADRYPNGTVYYRRELLDARAEVDEDPSPLFRLRASQNYSSMTPFCDWRRECVLIPLTERKT